MSTLLKVMAALSVSGLVTVAIQQRTNNTLMAQAKARDAAVARSAVESALNVASSLFASGTIGIAESGGTLTVHYAAEFTGPRWPIEMVSGFSTMIIEPCYEGRVSPDGFGGASSCDEKDPVPVMLAFLRRDPVTQKVFVLATRKVKAGTFQQTALLDSLAFQTVPELTCAYKLFGIEDDEHVYDQRGVLGSSGVRSSWHAVRWNVAKKNTSWDDEPGHVKNVTIHKFGVQIGGRLYGAGEALPKTLDFASPVTGRLFVTLSSDDFRGTMGSKPHDIRQYFKADDVGVDGITMKLSPSNPHYPTVEFKHCNRKYEPARVMAVSLPTMCRMAPWNKPFPGAC